MITISGCGQKNSRTQVISEGLSFFSEIETESQKYKFEVKIPDIHNMTMKAVYPDRLNGTVFEFDDDSVNIICKDLEYKINLSSMPKISPVNFIHEVYCDINSKKYDVSFENDQFFVSGKSENYEYDMFIGTTGLPLKISDEANGISAVISQATVIK